MRTIRLNISDNQGIFLGSVELTEDELSAARRSPMAAVAILDDICSEAGAR